MKSPLRVLLVEDHIPTLQALCICLGDLGHQVIPVGSMSAALHIAKNATFDALVCDIALPDGDGWQLLRKMQGKKPPLAVAISGLSGDRERQRSLEVGYTSHLEKPFPPAALEQALSSTEMKGH